MENNQVIELSESEIQKQIVDWLKIEEAIIFRMNAGKTTKNVTPVPNGTPDLLVVTKQGFVCWIEVKTAKGKLRDSQIDMICSLKERKQEILIARSLEQVQEYINRMSPSKESELF